MTDYLTRLHGEKHIKICTNTYLKGQFQMKCGLLEEALVSLKKAFALMAEIKDEFKEDIHVVRSKFHTTVATTTFMLGKWEEARTAA